MTPSAPASAIDGELDQLRLRLHHFSARQPGCLALQSHYGIGPLTGVAIWEELGDTRRFPNSTAAVRHSGPDITVYSSDTTRARGHLSRQGPAVLRWALFEAAMPATHNRPITPTTAPSKTASAPNGPPSPSPANSSAAATTPCASSETRRGHQHR